MIIGMSMDQEICLMDRFHSVYSIGRESSRRIYVVRGETDKNGKRHPGQTVYGENSGRNWEEMLTKLREKQSQLKNQSSMMPEDYEEFISLTPRTRNSKKPLGMLGRNWEYQWLPLCLARHARKVRKERPIERRMISSQNLRVYRKPVNPQDCVWKNLYQIIMRTISQEEGTIHCNITIWYTNLFLCLKQ